MLLGDDDEEDISCQTLLDGLDGVHEASEGCSKLQLTAFQAGCCDENFVPQNTCSLCPDGKPFRESITIPRTAAASSTTTDQRTRELTCGDLANEPSFLDFFNAPGDCGDTYLQRSAGWCECSGREVECSICPDGSRIPDPTKMEKVLYGWDCATFEYVTALLTRDECPMASHVLEFDASAFCCPHVVSPPAVCSFCPNTQVLGDPDKEIATEFGLLKCGDVAESLSLVPTEESCHFARSKFNAEQCCVYRDRPTSSGTAAPMASPQFAAFILAAATVGLAL
jgi:hypothetical protein